MIVLNPNNTYNTIKLIPRYNDINNTHSISLYDEDTRNVTSANIIQRTLSNGYIYYVIDDTFSENKSYRITVTDTVTNTIYFRGKLFTTSQSKQNYQING